MKYEYLKLEHVFEVLKDCSQLVFPHNGRGHGDREGWEADGGVSRAVHLDCVLSSWSWERRYCDVDIIP